MSLKSPHNAQRTVCTISNNFYWRSLLNNISCLRTTCPADTGPQLLFPPLHNSLWRAAVAHMLHFSWKGLPANDLSGFFCNRKNIDQSADCRRRLACPRWIQGSKAVEQALQSYNKLHVAVFHHTLTPDTFSVLTSCTHTLHFVGTLVESRVRCISTPYM